MSPSAELEQLLASAPHPREAEGEAFFNTLAGMADRTGRSQALRQVALDAARSALRGAKRKWPRIEGEGEYEAEAEAAAEMEAELMASLRSPRSLADVARMEHLGHAAAEAESEQEAAEQFLPLIGLAAKALLPMAAKALPKLAAKVAPKLISRVAPTLTRGVGNLARTLFRQPQTRQLLRAVPRIARSTVGNLVRRAANGRPVNATVAARTLANQTLKTLGRPRQVLSAYRRSRKWDQRFHRQAAHRVGPPARSGGTGGGVQGGVSGGGSLAPGSAQQPGMAGAAGLPNPAAMAPVPGVGGQAVAIPGYGACVCRPVTCAACGR